MTKKFTSKEQDILIKNPYTLFVTDSTIKFTTAFKEEFWKRYQRGDVPRKIMADLNYSLEVLGKNRINGICQHIKNEAYSKKGFHEYNKRPDPKFQEINKSTLSDNQALVRMQSELIYMRQELDFIKKIINPDNSRSSKT